MKPFTASIRMWVLLGLALVVLPGCQSTDGGSTHVSGSVYYGVGFYDPWYYGDYDGDIDIIVPPPDERPDRPGEPARPTHPIAPTPSPRPSQPTASQPAPRPTPMPSIPRTPRVRAR
jgi:hypothetical protein